MKTQIYILVDPISNQVRYVGKSNNPSQRYRNHRNRCRDKNTHKRNWINKLRLKGLYPQIEVIDTVNITEWKFWEKFWIQYFKYLGCNLTNHLSGGDGLTFGNQTSFKKGHKPWNLGISHSTETKELLRNNLLGKPSKKRKTVQQFSLDGILTNTFSGCYEAAESVNGQPIRICDVCNGKRKTHKNYIWKYKN